MVTHDGRLAAGIWSWNSGEPNNVNNEDCASQWGNGRWNDARCSNYYAFACEDDNRNWAVSASQGQWSYGISACSSLGGSYAFSTPSNSQDNEKLKIAKAAMGYSTVWLNHNDQASEGVWSTPLSSFRGKRNVAFRSVHGKYFVAESKGNNSVNANRSAIGSWEKFDIISLEGSACIRHNDTVAISTQTGYYLRASSNGGLDARASAINAWERYGFINHSDRSGCLASGDLVTLKSLAHNKYVVAESNGAANANRGAIGSWERLRVVFK